MTQFCSEAETLKEYTNSYLYICLVMAFILPHSFWNKYFDVEQDDFILAEVLHKLEDWGRSKTGEHQLQLQWRRERNTAQPLVEQVKVTVCPEFWSPADSKGHVCFKSGFYLRGKTHRVKRTVTDCFFNLFFNLDSVTTLKNYPIYLQRQVVYSTVSSMHHS